jgi:hypothetical protein
MLKNFINFPLFLLSLAIGLLFVYLTEAPKRVIYVYPNPSNVDKFRYKDDANNCFKYIQTSVECPSDSKDITEVPIQA